MREELFKVIGNIENQTENDENMNREETDRTYTSVMKKIRKKESGDSKKKLLIRLISATAVTAAAIGIIIYSGSGMVKKPLENETAVRVTGSQLKPQTEKNIRVFVYEAKNESQTVSPLYAEELSKKEVTAGEKVSIGKYNPAMSSVPGFPLTVSGGGTDSGNQESSYLLKIKTDGGILMQWDRESGKITEIGKEGTFRSGDNIFWSPIEDGTVCRKTELEIQLIQGENVAAGFGIRMEEQASGWYTAEKIK